MLKIEFITYSEADGAYALTKTGTIGLAVLLVAIIVLAAFLLDRRNVRYSTKTLVSTAVCLALAYALSFVKIIQMPWGGSVTLCSMLFITLVGYFYGAKMGLVAGLAFGVLQLLQDGAGYMLSLFQVGCDYIFAFMALGVSGFFWKHRHGLILGYIVAALMRGVFHVIGGYIYWMEYMPENFPKAFSGVYPIAYNFAYILPEVIATVVILCVPAVKKVIDRIRRTI